MNCKYTNIRLILEKIRRNPMLREIPLETVVDYTEDFIRIVGCPAEFLEKTAVIKIDRYKGDLPDDFHDIIQVREASDSLAEDKYISTEALTRLIYSLLNEYDDGYGETAVQVDSDANAIDESVVFSVMDVDNGGYGSLSVSLDVDNEREGDIDMSGFSFRSGYRPMRASTDTFHMDGQPKGCRELTYRIQNHRIFTSEESGYVEIAYLALAIDEDGLPLIPDNSKFTRALEWYIKLQHYTNMFECGKVDAHVLENTQREYCWAVGAYESECHRLSIDEMQSITNSLNTLVMRTTDYDKSFIHEGSREYIRRQ